MRNHILLFAFILIYSAVFPSADSTPRINKDSSLILRFDPSEPWNWKEDRYARDTFFLKLPGMNLFSGFPAAPQRRFVHPLVLSSVNLPLSYSGSYRPDMDEFRADLYNSRVPYTWVFGEFSTKNAQGIRLIHSRNFRKRYNLTAGINRFNGEGHYQRQSFNHEHYFLTGNFLSSRHRYGMYFTGEFRAMKRFENGGIAADSFFTDGSLPNKKLIPVRLDGASSRSVGRSLTIAQFFYLKGLDTAAAKNSGIWPEGSCFFVETGISDGWFVYKDIDPQSGFYANILRDSIETNDSSWVLRGSGKAGIHLAGPGTYFRTYYKADFQEYWQEDHHADFLDHYVGTEFGIKPSQYSKCTAIIEYNPAGDRKGQWHASVRIFDLRHAVNPEREKRKWIHSLELESAETYPSHFLERYSSNHFQWNYSLPKQLELNAEIFTQHLKSRFRAGASFRQYRNLFVLWYDGGPAILGQDIAWSGFWVKKDFVLGKFRITPHAQYNLLNSTLIQLPEITASLDLYYQYRSKTKSIWFRAGLKATYVSEYTPGVFIPALQMYARNDTLTAGNYVSVDTYTALRVKWVMLYFRCDNAASGLFGNNYFLAPHYPADDRAFRLGIVWRFFD